MKRHTSSHHMGSSHHNDGPPSSHLPYWLQAGYYCVSSFLIAGPSDTCLYTFMIPSYLSRQSVRPYSFPDVSQCTDVLSAHSAIFRESPMRSPLPLAAATPSAYFSALVKSAPCA